MTSKLLLTALAAASVAVPTLAQAQKAPAAVIVVVDSERVYSECTACKSAVAQLNSKQQAAQTRQQTLSGPLQTEAQALQKAVEAAAGKPDAALTARINAFETKKQAANQELARLAQDLQSTQVNVRRQIDAKVGPIITQVMNSKGANVALDVDATLAASSTINVTNEVLAALNAQLPAVSVTPLPQQAKTAPQGR